MSRQIILTVQEAIDLVKPGDEVHVFRCAPACLIGADWSRTEVLKLINDAQFRQIGGDACVALSHGLVATLNGENYFIASDVAGKIEAHQ